jgi:hypothetical protein
MPTYASSGAVGLPGLVSNIAEIFTCLRSRDESGRSPLRTGGRVSGLSFRLGAGWWVPGLGGLGLWWCEGDGERYILQDQQEQTQPVKR